MKKLKPIYLCESCDAVLSTKRQYCDDRCRQIELCKCKGTAKYRNKFVAPDFQAMIRAEAAALPSRTVQAVVNGIIRPVHRVIGEVVCVTCGLVGPWYGGVGFRQMQTGHFCSRKDQSVLFTELNVAVQCARCNQPPGSPNEFRIWMTDTRGIECIELIEGLARHVHSFTRDELVDMRIEFLRRLKAAQQRMKE